MTNSDINENCIIVVSSCDEYKDLWDSHFIVLKDQYPDIKMPVILLTEKEDYECAHMPVSVYRAGRTMKWGKRLRKMLNNIDTDYIVLLLDDYYPLSRIDHGKWQQCYDWMQDNKDIASFTFVPVLSDNINDGKYEGFEKRPLDAEYRVTCQPGIWRRERLIELIEPYYTPWDFELVGTMRSAIYDDCFYSRIESEEPLYNHDFAKYGLRKGKWGIATKVLFAKHGIEMDFTIRGFFDDGLPKTEKKQGVISTVLEKIKNKVRSIRVRRVREQYNKIIMEYNRGEEV